MNHLPTSLRRLPLLVAAATVVVGALASCGDAETDAAPSASSETSAAEPAGTADGDELAGFVRSPTPVVDHVTLPDVGEGGGDFTFRAPDDGVLLVYFGYTSCPDVCPTTLADIRWALSELAPAQADSVEVAMATIDPERDTDRVLTDYLRAFVDDGRPLRTLDDERLRVATDAFGADYAVETDDEGEVEVLHTGSLYAVDEEGRLVVTWPFGVSNEDLLADLETLLDGGP